MTRAVTTRVACAAAVLFFAVPVGAQTPCAELARGTAGHVIGRPQLEAAPSRSALDLIEQYVPNAFQIVDGALAVRARGARSLGRITEPLLVLDGIPRDGLAASVLSDLRAGDLDRIEVHVGAAATWRFRPGGAAAVIEVTTLASQLLAMRAGATCIGRIRKP